MGVIYVITNSVNGKKYVGQTARGQETRWTQHKCNVGRGLKSYLYSAIRKHGIENFEMKVLETVADDALSACEIKWIGILQTADAQFGYNCTPGGEGATHGPSSRARQKGWRVQSQETKDKISRAHLGRKVPREQVERHRMKMLGRKCSPEEIAKRIASNRLVWKNKAPEELAAHGAKTAKNMATREKMPWEYQTPESLAIVHRKNKEWWDSPASAETKRLLAERVRSMDHVANSAKAWETRRAKGPEYLSEVNRKIGDGQRAFQKTPEAVEMHKRLWTEEKRKSLADKFRGRKASDESRERMRVAAIEREAKKKGSFAEIVTRVKSSRTKRKRRGISEIPVRLLEVA